MSTRTIVASFDSPDRLLSSMLDDQQFGGIFHPTEEQYELGETVIVDVRLPEIPEGIPLIGNVVWRRRPTKWKTSLIPGSGIAFQPESGPQRDFLIMYAHGKLQQRRKTGIRCRLNVPVEMTIAGMMIKGWTRDIGRGGLYVPADRLPPVGHQVGVTILPNDFTRREELSGQVAWSHEPCGHNMIAGFGVAFRHSNAPQRRRLDMLVAPREAQIHRETGFSRRTMKW